MRWTRSVAGLSALGAAVLAVVAVSCSQQAPVTSTASAMDPVARGKYLVTIMSCTDCHTPGTMYGAPDTTRLLSGSELGWNGPWGTSYPRNLTPDSTGLAAWSEADIVKALRTGQRPDGRLLNPPMPWQNFGGLTDEDVHAIASYLKSLKPISHHVPDVVPPGQKAPTAMYFPPPPAWDAQNMPPPTEGAKK